MNQSKLNKMNNTKERTLLLILATERAEGSRKPIHKMVDSIVVPDNNIKINLFSPILLSYHYYPIV